MTVSTPTITPTIILMGDGGVGKTTFLKRHLNGQFISNYIANDDITTYRLNF